MVKGKPFFGSIVCFLLALFLSGTDVSMLGAVVTRFTPMPCVPGTDWKP